MKSRIKNIASKIIFGFFFKELQFEKNFKTVCFSFLKLQLLKESKQINSLFIFGFQTPTDLMKKQVEINDELLI